VFSIFIYKRFTLARKQKHIIEQQKQLVETKNEEILDSINYAKRLQEAILPQMKEIKRVFDADILFLPKDIIGGDFYFFERYHNRIYFAVCDCTGHGVPGALMSVVCYQALEKAIKEFKLETPDEILAKAREIIIDNLNAKIQNIKDGMDCSLLVFDPASGKFEWAGANNGLIIIRKDELIELKPDKQAVAYDETRKDFTRHELSLSPGDVIYLYTDGYADQFGGLEGKKYKSKALKDFLVDISHDPVEKQVEHLRVNFMVFKGDHDQVDDVSLAVIRVS
jgi:serine phosphatase RsbU (regulator of sigma subunit)